MQTLRKKGLAETLSSVMLISLAIASVIFAGWSLMKIFYLADIQSSPTLNCFEAQTSFNKVLTISKACYNSESQIELTVQRNSLDNKINYLTFTLGDELWKCSNECGDCAVLDPSTTKTYFLTPSTNPEGKTIKIYADACDLDQARILKCAE